ncbi:hypothetical protein [Streptomyces sp. VRA16 Mangrove soil]|uniref:hypothetical protein n=1 Tax=Streptomyces sp. VRA16 Mangrove soil TaxID=2817434 RepID=UPI001A9F7FAA|nr:hypothetical protein [Streptomyces sp. VRA16 Mangrove soil]MBO1332616.1 hypothetical protein [Streptomyces sp. VRA16 Mangrove soil]
MAQGTGPDFALGLLPAAPLVRSHGGQRLCPGRFLQLGRDFARVLTRSLADRSRFCDLLSAQAGVLEHNVSSEVAARYKRAALANVDVLAELARMHLPELHDREEQLSAQIILVIGAVWIHSQPSPAMLAAYEADPSLAAQRMEFAPALENLVTTLVAGTLARTITS